MQATLYPDHAIFATEQINAQMPFAMGQGSFCLSRARWSH